MKSFERVRVALAFGVACAAFSYAGQALAGYVDPQPQKITHYHYTSVDGVKIFYREAGPRAGPVVVLLHGFPTSSQQYRNHSGTFGSLSRDRAGLSGVRPE